MARTKLIARSSEKPFMTWTRFYLPQDQQWPTWAVDHDDVHAGPLADVEGYEEFLLGRMVDHPEQAAYVIRWETLDAFNKFQSSPACTEFLRNLPEYPGDGTQASIVSGSALSHLTLEDAPSRFQVFQHAWEGATPEGEGLVTMTTFLVPYEVDDKYQMWHDKFKDFNWFAPEGAEDLTIAPFWAKSTHVWYWLVAEDRSVWEKFGKPEQQMQEGGPGPGRTIFCHFFLWTHSYNTKDTGRNEAAAEMEKAVAADPMARESWEEAIAELMPPVTAWVQERWNIEAVPRFFPPSPELDPEEAAYEREQQKLLREYLEYHGFKVGEGSQ